MSGESGHEGRVVGGFVASGAGGGAPDSGLADGDATGAAGGAPVEVCAPDADAGGPVAGGVASASDGGTPKSPMPKRSGKGFIVNV